MKYRLKKFWKRISPIVTSNIVAYALVALLIYLAVCGILSWSWTNAIESRLTYFQAMGWVNLVAMGAIVVQAVVEWVKYIKDNF